jgi:hypothetical protein
MFGNALPLLLNFVVNLRQRGFARRSLPNTPHDNPIPQQKHPARRWSEVPGRNTIHESALNSVHANKEMC